LADVNRVADLYQRILAEVSKAVIGKEETKEALMLALVAGGHVLVEGLPGTAKTKLARAFAEVVGGDFKRIQFTPDMLPADVTGFYIYSPDGTSRFIQGPVFANVVLADELSRTTPRTQSALLEAMQESQVTIEGRTYPLAKPFMVIATQVKVGGEGTYPLTDVQVDRFLLSVNSEYASREEEKRIILDIDRIDEPDVRPVTTMEEIGELQQVARKVHVSPEIVDYTTAIMSFLRLDHDVQAGPSIRGGIALHKCSRVLALLEGRDYVVPDDVKHLARNAFQHRIRVKVEAEMDDITPGIILERALEGVAVPKLPI